MDPEQLFYRRKHKDTLPKDFQKVHVSRGLQFFDSCVQPLPESGVKEDS